MKYKLTCPHCGEEIEGEPISVRNPIWCPQCHKPIGYKVDANKEMLYFLMHKAEPIKEDPIIERNGFNVKLTNITNTGEVIIKMEGTQ
jgi:DNA-directed RNA polymerase subunit RPC12/RpoP